MRPQVSGNAQARGPAWRNSAPLAEPGEMLGRLIEGIPYDAYAVTEGINQTGLGHMLHSGARYRDWQQTPPDDDADDTPSLQLGRLAHLCILEPDVYDSRIVVAPSFSVQPKLTIKAQSAEWAAGLPPESIVVSAAKDAQVRAMRDGVWRNPEAKRLLRNGLRETCIWWDDATHRVRCKARLDFVSHAHKKPIVLDLKTARDATREAFSRSIVQNRYDLQAAHYLAAGRSSGAYDHERYYFLVVESRPPYMTVLYAPSVHMKTLGHQWREEAMRLYAQCMATDTWPPLPAIDTIDAPHWAKVPGQDDWKDDAR